MRRIGRWMLNALTALSLLLCVVTCVPWVRSYRTFDRGFICGPVHDNAQSVLDADSLPGHIKIALTRTEGFSLGTSPRMGNNLYSEDLPDDPTWYLGATHFGFRLSREVKYRTFDHTARTPPKYTTWTIVLPYWSPAAVLGLLPVTRLLIILRRAHRVRANRCARCNYDLTGNVSGVCPECGMKIAEAK